MKPTPRPVGALRADFPALAQKVNGRPVAYLDSAASAQKPQAVIDAMTKVMTEHYANVHRGVYTFGAKTSAAYEAAREKTARFLNAASEKQIVFTRNATEAINLVAATWGETFLQAGDEIILTELEHHANIVPWHMLRTRKGVVIKVVPVRADGALDMQAFESLLSPKTKLLAVTHMSNALGTVNPVADMIAKAHAAGAKVLVDGSQAVVHLNVDVQALDADFYVFTGHKLYGPSGIGVLYGKADILAAMPPYQGGGEMIEDVTFDNVTYKEPPYRFEAGTPAIVEAIGLGAAIDWLNGIDKDAALAHEAKLLADAEEKLRAIDGVRIFSTAPERASILSFELAGVHPHDMATVFDQMGLCVRAGNHCAQPLMRKLGVAATVRASFALYNSMEDVERLAEAILKAKRLFE
ncbi:MAG TPA: cysteine desulfurase [Alphaproteobacteria bacterium]|nr:cysteine desulfurase [Rhodospirillaceae bacterium]HRJ65651.1 cysteine desulfurase [Alphaproteobacteria bacterium]